MWNKSTEMITREKKAVASEKYQQKHDQYKKVLLAPYCNYKRRKNYEQTLDKIFQEDLPALQEIFSLERFAENDEKNTKQASKDHDLCIYKIFLRTSIEEKLSTEKQWEILDWLIDSGIEQILTSRKEGQVIELLITTNNQTGVAWALQKYGDSQLLEIFTSNRRKLSDWLREGIQETGNRETADIVMVKSMEILGTLENSTEQRKKLAKQIEQINTITQGVSNSYY